MLQPRAGVSTSQLETSLSVVSNHSRSGHTFRPSLKYIHAHFLSRKFPQQPWPANGFFWSAQYPHPNSTRLVSTSYDPTPDTTVSLDSAGFYFTKDRDVLLSISIRRHQNRIIFNTRQGGTWGREQLVVLQDVFPGPRAIIHVTANTTTYNISINDSSNIHTFTKVIQGDPTGVLYFENNSKPAFSNPVITAVFGVYTFLSALIAPIDSYAYNF